MQIVNKDNCVNSNLYVIRAKGFHACVMVTFNIEVFENFVLSC